MRNAGAADRLQSYSMFPDPRIAGSEDLVFVGGNLSITTLYQAYAKGIFPWPQDDYPLFWVCPSQRGILRFTDLHIPRSLKKAMKRNRYQITINTCFDEVIRACRLQKRPNQEGTWILPQIERAYKAFHRAGFAHSVEYWQDGELAGGLYGVYVDGVFSGESMFYHVPNASKICLVELAQILAQKGLKWIDTQMVTPILASFGAKYIRRNKFLDLLTSAKANHPRKLF